MFLKQNFSRFPRLANTVNTNQQSQQEHERSASKFSHDCLFVLRFLILAKYGNPTRWVPKVEIRKKKATCTVLIEKIGMLIFADV